MDKYNNLGVILRCIPSTAPLASNTNYALEVDASLLQQGSILNQDPYIVKVFTGGTDLFSVAIVEGVAERNKQ